VKFSNKGIKVPKRSRYSAFVMDGRPRERGRTWWMQVGARTARMASMDQVL
jgi:hypothetical protein